MRVFLETERLVLRRFTGDDLDLLIDLDSDAEVMRYVNGGSPTPREEIARVVLPRILGYYERYEGYGLWAAIARASGAFLGWFHLRPTEDGIPNEPDLGYRLCREAWGKGYATEASRALIRKGFAKLGARRVVATAAASNIASRRVLEKAGLTLVRRYRVTYPDRFAGIEQDKVEYALERADWERQEADGA